MTNLLNHISLQTVMDRRRLNKLNDNMDPIPIFALHKQMTIALNNLKLMTANKYRAHVSFFDSI